MKKIMKIKLSEISNYINTNIDISNDISIQGVCSLENPKSEHLSFFNGKSETAFLKILESSNASAIIIPKDLKVDSNQNQPYLIRSEYPQRDFIKVLKLFSKEKDRPRTIHSLAVIEPTAVIGKNVHISPFCYIGENCIIGDNCYIHPHVTIYEGVKLGCNSTVHSKAVLREHVQIGENVIIQNGAIIGADGFGYIPSKDGLETVPQIGNVILGNNVDVGANSCIDRAALDSTKIGFGTKVDNLVQIGHNTQVGSHTIICGQAAIAGSSKIGNQVVLGGNVGVADHAEITDGCRFAGFSGVIGKYKEKGDYAGNPAIPIKLYRKVTSILPNIPEIVKNLKKDSA